MAYGAILGKTSSGKRVCRLVVGTSTSGWTTSDCDYLCDGTADDVEINAAIQALPDTGGEIVILDGTYNITATIAMNKDNTKLLGNGAATILKRMWDGSGATGVIYIKAANGGCCVENLQIDGNKATYQSNANYGIFLYNSNNCIVTGITCSNNANYGIILNNSNNCIVMGNTCNNNEYGIYVYNSANNTVTGNTCKNNVVYSIILRNSNDNTVTGNTCNNNNSYGIIIYSSNNNTITGNTCNNNEYGIDINADANNNTVTGNTCNNNEYGIYIVSNSNDNTVTGNTCNNNNSYGIILNDSDNCIVTGNTCNNNEYGIYVYNSANNTVTGNTCIRGTGQSSDYTSSQYTIYVSGVDSNYNLIADNNIMGKNYVSGGGTGNTFVNNKFK